VYIDVCRKKKKGIYQQRSKGNKERKTEREGKVKEGRTRYTKKERYKKRK
jgi:hypothetical protein